MDNVVCYCREPYAVKLSSPRFKARCQNMDPGPSRSTCDHSEAESDLSLSLATLTDTMVQRVVLVVVR